MRQKIAKKLRNMVYGDGSKRDKGVYFRNEKTGALIVDPKGKKKKYKDLKKLVRMGIKVD